MNAEEIIKHARTIRNNKRVPGFDVEIREFLRTYAGENSSFYFNIKKLMDKYDGKPGTSSGEAVFDILDAFVRYAEKGLLEGISIERKAQIDVVSDFLEQATFLLNDRGVHPAAPAVIIGAALEEFLRNWVEDFNLDLAGKPPSLDSYAKVLKEAKLITKQDIKDITSWTGLRNHAAHGEWDEVNNKNRISIMLEAVNLFMRKYGERNT